MSVIFRPRRGGSGQDRNGVRTWERGGDFPLIGCFYYNKTMIIPIILSGGAGTRLWPLSWGEHPKQFLPLVSDKTMIQETLLRLKGLELGAPIISCGEGHRFMVAQQIGEVISEVVPTGSTTAQILLEPMAKNTAPAIAAACCAAMKQDKDAVVIVLPSDHVIADVQAFQVIVAALKVLERGVPADVQGVQSVAVAEKPLKRGILSHVQ